MKENCNWNNLSAREMVISINVMLALMNASRPKVDLGPYRLDTIESCLTRMQELLVEAKEAVTPAGKQEIVDFADAVHLRAWEIALEAGLDNRLAPMVKTVGEVLEEITRIRV